MWQSHVQLTLTFSRDCLVSSAACMTPILSPVISYHIAVYSNWRILMSYLCLLEDCLKNTYWTNNYFCYDTFMTVLILTQSEKKEDSPLSLFAFTSNHLGLMLLILMFQVENKSLCTEESFEDKIDVSETLKAELFTLQVSTLILAKLLPPFCCWKI